MSERCVPGPINTCTTEWSDPAATDPQGRLQAHVRTHPTGALEARCDTDGNGLAVCIEGDPEPVDPAPNQTAGIAVTTANKLYAVLPARTRKTIAAASVPSVTNSETLVADSTIELDNTAGAAVACWEVCVDVCNAWIDCPQGDGATVSIPPSTSTVPDAGGDVTHSHGTITVTPADKAPVTMNLTIGDNYSCAVLAADRDYQAGGGRFCTDVEVPAGQSVTVPVGVDLDVPSGVSGGFPASSGLLTVTFYPVACATNC